MAWRLIHSVGYCASIDDSYLVVLLGFASGKEAAHENAEEPTVVPEKGTVHVEKEKVIFFTRATEQPNRIVTPPPIPAPHKRNTRLHNSQLP